VSRLPTSHLPISSTSSLEWNSVICHSVLRNREARTPMSPVGADLKLICPLVTVTNRGVCGESSPCRSATLLGTCTYSAGMPQDISAQFFRLRACYFPLSYSMLPPALIRTRRCLVTEACPVVFRVVCSTKGFALMLRASRSSRSQI